MDILKNIEYYKEKITISQVVSFFERNDIHFTKSMIQNYGKLNVIPPLNEKRYYTKKHLAALVLIHYLKQIYSLDEIKSLFGTAFLEESTEWQTLYDKFVYVYNEEEKKEDKDIFELAVESIVIKQKVSNKLLQ